MKPFTLRDAITKFLEVLEIQRKVSVHTLRAYSSDLVEWLEEMGAIGFSEISTLDRGLKPVHLRSYLAKRVETHEKSSLCRKLSSIRSFLKFARREGWITREIGSLVPSPKLKRHLPRFLRIDEAKELDRKSVV